MPATRLPKSISNAVRCSLASFTLLFVIGACGGSASRVQASPGAPVTFKQGVTAGTPGNALADIAVKDGLFQKENIDAQLLPSGTTGTIVAAVSSGELDGGFVSVTTAVNTWQKGVKVHMLGGFLPSPRGLVVPIKDKSTPVASGTETKDFEPTLKALKGKNIGIPGVGGALGRELDYLAKLAGLPPNSFNYIDVQPGTPVLATLKNASVDAIYNGQFGTEQAVALGYARTVMTTANAPDSFRKSVLVGTMVSDKFLEAHPDFAGRWQRVMQQASAIYNDPSKRQHIADVLASYNVNLTGVDAGKYIAATPALASVPKTTMAGSLDFLLTAGVVASTPKPNVVDVIVKEALT